jgi:hypothetical protein
VFEGEGGVGTVQQSRAQQSSKACEYEYEFINIMDLLMCWNSNQCSTIDSLPL